MIIIGLTGNIGTGKSTVSQMLSELGAKVINADKVGHRLLESDEEVRQEIIRTFGERILNPGQQIDRGKLGELVFSHPEALRELNRIMHPRMRRLVEEEIGRLRQEGARVVVLEAPLLIEAGWQGLADQIWVTSASPETIVQRLRERSGLSAEQVRARLQAQLPMEEKERRADILINTDCDLAQVRTQVEAAWRKVFHLGTEELKQRIRRILARTGRRRIEATGLVPAAVLVPLLEKEGKHHVLLIKRTQSVAHHKGEVSFPGGVVEEGESALEAALRESFEEIGLHPEDAEILGELDEDQTAESNFLVRPFVAFIPFPYDFRASREEVEEIVLAPFADFLSSRNLERRTREGRENFEYLYHVEGQVIWGATARILKKFFDLVFDP